MNTTAKPMGRDKELADAIAGRRAAEAALRESERRYREVFDNVTDSIFVFDVTDDGRFRFASVNGRDS